MKRLLWICLIVIVPMPVAGEKIVRAEMTFDVGSGFYTGSFLRHLEKDGAYTVTPTLDGYFSSFIFPFAGLQLHIGAGSVIHPYSEPIEGVLIYFSVGPFFKWDLGKVYLKVWAGAGYQQPSMSLQWYGSGFTEWAGGVGFDFNETNSLILSCKYRQQFLQSVIIYQKYDSLEENDNLASITLSLGWVTRW